jgi:RNA polymerase sigma factor (sigma-70 family)
MLDPQRIAPTHAALFLDRYERMRQWALRLTERNHERAEDLLHDAFIQFTLSHPDLDSIHDLDSYLFVTLRNLHLSQMRRATRTIARELSIIEYDSAELGLWSIDPRDQIKTQDQLRTVCYYACMRKKTAKAASVLILRFFHGYYPQDVAKVLQISRGAVKDRLRLARAEARLYLTDSSRLNLIQEDHAAERPHAEVGRVTDDLLSELRQTIFASRDGVCFTLKQLEEFYSEDKEALECSAVAHLVSCAKCLDNVNRIVRLPLLAERYATDTLGKDTGKKGGPGDSGGVSSGGSTAETSINKSKSRAEQVYRHEPQELCIAVNGYPQGTQKISSEQNEFSLVIDMPEQIGFIEVFSELGVRLLLLNVDPLPAGTVRQEARVELSEGRTLDASLSFSGAWPTVRVAYSDPLATKNLDLSSTRSLPLPVLTSLPTGTVVDSDPLTVPADKTSFSVTPLSASQSLTLESTAGAVATGSRMRSRIVWYLRHLLPPAQFWMRPATITAALAVLLIAAFVIWRNNPSRTITVEDLLRQSAYAEEVALSRPDTVIHRTLQVEQRRQGDNQIIARQRIEIWQSGANGLTARRLYNDRGELLAGEWTRRSDSVRTLYHHGARPELQLRDLQLAIRNFDEVWLVDLTTQDFAAIAVSPQSIQVQNTADTYVINYAAINNVSASSGTTPIYKGQPPSLIRATLVLNRTDLHPIEQTLVIRQGNETREFRLIETAFERRSASSVAPAVFEPEPFLLGPDAARRHAETGSASASPAQPATPSPVLATAELEVEVLRLLNGAGGDLSDQVTVTRTSEGRLRIDGTVETLQRKNEIIHALAQVRHHPAVTIAIETIAEASKRERSTSTGPIEVQQVDIAKSALPIEPELRRCFSAKGVAPDQFDQEMSRFADRVMRRSLKARLYARTLKQTLNRFSADDLRTLKPDARQNLNSLIREQANSLQHEIVTLRGELQLIVPGVAGDAGFDQMQISSDADLLRAVNRLGELVSQVDEAVRVSFSISSDSTTYPPIKEPQFWRALKSTETLAAQIGGKQ